MTKNINSQTAIEALKKIKTWSVDLN